MAGSILVVTEHLKGEFSDITFEMLGAGREIADALNIPIYSITYGEGAEPLASRSGIADTAFFVDIPGSTPASPEILSSFLRDLVEEKGISLILIGGTNASMGIGPLLAANAQFPFLNFCTDFHLKEEKILFTCQLFGGKILTEVSLSDNRGVVSINPGSFPAETGRSDQAAHLERIDYSPKSPRVSFKRFLEPEAEDVDITKQDILIGIGRGIQTQDNLELVDELAEVIGGVVCGSRPVIDQGWLPLSRQVGKSGKIVKPKLYLALGISGAPEHTEGMQNAEMIIPINSDPEAPIFSLAHYGVKGDIFDILPPLIEALRERRKAG